MSRSVFKNINSLCLASASPRRKLLAARLGLPLEIIRIDAEEKPGEGAPEKVAEELACQKAQAVLEKHMPGPNEVILTADTSVWLEGRMFGKPSGEAEAKEMLRALSGKDHEVITGCALLYRGGLSEIKTLLFSSVTTVTVDELTDEEIDAYVSSGDPLDKAGAYGIQGDFGVHVRSIKGSYDNVVGLPVNRIYSQLKKIDAEIGRQ